MKRKPQIDMGEDVVSPYLWSRRITHLDYAVLTHGHSDHMGGLGAVLDNFHPQALWIGVEPDTPEWRGVKKVAARDNVPIIPLKRGVRTAPLEARRSVSWRLRRIMCRKRPPRTTTRS